MSDLQYQREALERRGQSTATVDSLVAKIISCSNCLEANPLFELLENEAAKLDWPRDRDYAAIALQYALEDATPDLRHRMLDFAIDRARWCASCATAGGEGLARYEHVTELEKLIGKKA